MARQLAYLCTTYISTMPFGYRSGSTFLHRLPAGLKLLALLALSAAAFGSLAGLYAAAALLVFLSVLAKINPLQLLRGSKPLALLALFILLFKTIDTAADGLVLPVCTIPCISVPGFWGGLVLALRIFVSFAAGSLLFAVTTMGDLRRSLSRAEQALRAKLSIPGCNRVSLGISLMLGFIPRFFEIWETMNLACTARRAQKGIGRIKLLVPLVTERMMEAAARTAEALEARGI